MFNEPTHQSVPLVKQVEFLEATIVGTLNESLYETQHLTTPTVLGFGNDRKMLAVGFDQKQMGLVLVADLSFSADSEEDQLLLLAAIGAYGQKGIVGLRLGDPRVLTRPVGEFPDPCTL